MGDVTGLGTSNSYVTTYVTCLLHMHRGSTLIDHSFAIGRESFISCLGTWEMFNNKIETFPGKHTQRVYPTSNNQNENTTQIKIEPSNFKCYERVSHHDSDSTRTPAINNCEDHGINNFTMLMKERQTDSGLSKNSTEKTNPEKDGSFYDGLNFLVQRAEREFVSSDRKDSMYWSKRLKNNDSARRSRMKRRSNEKDIIDKLKSLQKENIELKYELASLNRHFAKHLDGTNLSELPNNECIDRTYENVSPLLTTSIISNGDLSSPSWNSPADEAFKKAAMGIPKPRPYFRDTTTNAEISDNCQSQKRVYNTISDEGSQFADKPVYSKINPSTTHVDHHTSSCDVKEILIAKDNQQVMETESNPVILNVFSLRNNFVNKSSFNDSLESKFGIQSIPHKYRHKRGFHSAFSVQS